MQRYINLRAVLFVEIKYLLVIVISPLHAHLLLQYESSLSRNARMFLKEDVDKRPLYAYQSCGCASV
jgi:hypothetical protein